MNRAPQKATRGDSDIINLIIDDHKPLKDLIEIMKDPDAELGDRRQAFEDFVPALLTHAKAEEKSLYTHMKKEDDLRNEGFEGEVEHNLALQLVEDAHSPSDDDLWAARVKVLAELVEEHIRQEENNFFPLLKEHSEKDERIKLGHQYERLKAKLEARAAEVSDDDIDDPYERHASH